MITGSGVGTKGAAPCLSGIQLWISKGWGQVSG